MYHRLGETVARFPYIPLLVWGIVSVALILTSPSFDEVWKNGEFAFLPQDSPSRSAQQLYGRAFPSDSGNRFEKESVGTSIQQDPQGSSLAIVLVRKDRLGLRDADFRFIENVLVPELERIQETTPRSYKSESEIDSVQRVAESEQVIKTITSFTDSRIGSLLISTDERATLVVLDLYTEFLDRQNTLILSRVEQLITSPQLLTQKPIGLAMALSGSATVGRDMLRAETLSASRTEAFTKFLVIVMLLLLYRAPFLALVPLATVGIAVELSLAMLRHLAALEWISLFTGLEVYVTVVVYGAGVDYCLFLIARYKEELDHGQDYAPAMSEAVRRVGAALATSAGTSICGIAMMMFSEYGKYRQAGLAISLGLFVALCFVLTFTPAILLLLNRWAFWPDIRKERISSSRGWISSPTLWKLFQEQQWLDKTWTAIADRLRRRPGFLFLTTLLIMLPFATVGLVYENHLNFGLLSDLPQDEPSVTGARIVRKHFAEGVTGPISVLIKFDREFLKSRFDGDDLTDVSSAEQLSEEFTKHLETRLLALGVVDIRNQTHPLGTSEAAKQYIDSIMNPDESTSRLQRIRRAKVLQTFKHRTYTSVRGDLAGRVMRVDLVTDEDPFSRTSMSTLTAIERAVNTSVKQALQNIAGENPESNKATKKIPADAYQIYSMGPTASIRDLKQSTDRDRLLIDVLVVVVVYVILVALLRQPAICGYLVISVVFSFLVSLGMTFVVFYLRDPSGFEGLDWKVPIYLFTILIAMGEDYNILLMARVTEEQKTHGEIEGVLVALQKTGSIISSCGIIMAGTFMSLMAGYLLGMVQLGFALAFGVLLDTFVVRPILVPAYLVLLYSGKFGWLGKYLGATTNSATMTIPEDDLKEH